MSAFDPDIGHHLLIIRTFCDAGSPAKMWFHGIDRWLPGFLRGDSLISHAWAACFVHFAEREVRFAESDNTRGGNMSTPTRRAFLRFAQGAIAAASIWAASADAQERFAVTVFENVRIFDGTHLWLSAPSNVLIRGNIIEQISTSPIPTDRRADTQIIAGGGRVLMPGLSDVHWHAMLVRPTPAQLLSSDIGY